MARRALASAAATAVVLSAVGLFYGDELETFTAPGFASFAQYGAWGGPEESDNALGAVDDAVEQAQGATDEAVEDAQDAVRDGLSSAARPQSGTGGPVVFLPFPFDLGGQQGDAQAGTGQAGSGGSGSRGQSTGLLAGTVAAVGNLLWTADIEDGDLSEFDDTPWNQVGSPDPEITSTVARTGDHSIAFTIPGGGNRNEVVPDMEWLDEGDELYFGFSTMLGDGFPIDESWQVITQWKNDGTGSPPIELAVENGEYSVQGGFGHPDGNRQFSREIAPASTGQWVDWVFHIRFSSDPDEGFIEIWKDGQLAVPRFSPDSGTLYPDLESYVKIGYYRNTGIDEDGTVYIDNWRVGSSMAGR